MTRNSRQFSGSISVRIGTRRTRLELSPAELHGGPEGVFRVRVDRRWHDLPEGGPAFLALLQVAELAAAMFGSESPAFEPEPDLPRGSVVSVPNGALLAGQTLRDVTRTDTAPMRGHDGRWYVGVTLYGKGCCMVPVNDLILKRKP